MGGVFDNQLRPIRGWPGGINNVLPETTVPATALRQAVNVNLDPAGKVSRRTGYVQRISGSAHSIMRTAIGMLAVVDGDLQRFDAALSPTTIFAGAGDRPLTAFEAAGQIYWSNSFIARRITPAGTDAPFWPVCAGQPQVAAFAAGGLSAGMYQVALTWLDADGRESGATLAVQVDVPEGGGIELTAIPTNADATSVSIYRTGPNGDVLYHAETISSALTSWIVGAGRRGRQLETQFLEPLPPADILRYHMGRAHAAVGRMHYWSESLRYGLRAPQNYARYDEPIAMLAPVGYGPDAGLYVAAGKLTYYLAGADPAKWQRAIARHAGVVPGTELQVPGTQFGLDTEAAVPYWLGSDGMFCVGLPGGRVLPLTEGRFVAPMGAQRGATLLREQNGLTQLITALLGGETNTMAASDSAVATVRKHGVAT